MHGVGTPSLAYVAVADPATLAPAGDPNPLLKQVDHAWLSLTERPAAAPGDAAGRPTTAPASPDAAVRLTVSARSPEAAQQLQAAAGGLKAMIALGAMPATAKPGLKFAAAALRTMTVTQQGSTVSADVWVAVDKLQQAIDRSADAAAAAADGPTGK